MFRSKLHRSRSVVDLAIKSWSFQSVGLDSHRVDIHPIQRCT
jgi:hypothetical protein